MADLMEINGVQVAPGTKQAIRVPVTQDLNGGEVAEVIHVIRGAKPGRTLGLIGLQHGDEWFDLQIMRFLVSELDPSRMCGTLLAVPVASPVAFGNLQRITQPESDGPDMNRIWPGVHTWLAESMAKVLDREFVRKCDAVLDFHPGPWGGACAMVGYGRDFPNQEIIQRGRDLAMAMGFPCVGSTRLMEVFRAALADRVHVPPTGRSQPGRGDRRPRLGDRAGAGVA